MQCEWELIAEIRGDIEYETDDVEEEIDEAIERLKPLFEIPDSEYRKSLRNFINNICLFKPSDVHRMFYEMNWKEVVEQSLFNDKRMKLETSLANIKV